MEAFLSKLNKDAADGDSVKRASVGGKILKLPVCRIEVPKWSPDWINITSCWQVNDDGAEQCTATSILTGYILWGGQWTVLHHKLYSAHCTRAEQTKHYRANATS